MRIIGIILACIVSVSAFACERAAPTTDKGFCASFKKVAICHCMKSLPNSVCSNISMETLYNMMVARYGSMETACKKQSDTSQQDCIDNWNCYRKGGKNSHGGLCSATGNKCA